MLSPATSDTRGSYQLVRIHPYELLHQGLGKTEMADGSAYQEALPSIFTTLGGREALLYHDSLVTASGLEVYTQA